EPLEGGESRLHRVEARRVGGEARQERLQLCADGADGAQRLAQVARQLGERRRVAAGALELAQRGGRESSAAGLVAVERREGGAAAADDALGVLQGGQLRLQRLLLVGSGGHAVDLVDLERQRVEATRALALGLAQGLEPALDLGQALERGAVARQRLLGLGRQQPVELAALRRRRLQLLGGVLPEHHRQAADALGELGHGDQLAVDARGVTAAARQAARRRLDRGGLQGGLHQRGLAAAADHAHVGATAGQQLQGVDDDRLAGARLAGQDVQAGGELELEPVDDREVLQFQRVQHAAQYRGRRRGTLMAPWPKPPSPGSSARATRGRGCPTCCPPPASGRTWRGCWRRASTTSTWARSCRRRRCRSWPTPRRCWSGSRRPRASTCSPSSATSAGWSGRSRRAGSPASATRCRSTTRSSAATWGARWRSRGRWWRGSSRAPPRAAWSWWSTCRWGSATRTATPGARPTPRRRWRGCASSGCGASPSPTRWATPTPRAWRRCSTPSTRPAAWGSTCTRGRAPGAGSSRRRWRAGCAGSRGRWGAWAAARSRATSWSATCPPRRCCRSWRPRATRWGSTWGACRRWRPRPRRWRRASSRRRRVRPRASRSAGRVGDRRLAQARELARGGRRERR